MYPSRVVGFGDLGGDPLVFFTLSSQSIPQRELRVLSKDEKHTEDKRVYVFPRNGYETKQSISSPEVDNYSCIVPGKNERGLWAISFNGHMAKRTNSNIHEGIPPGRALDLTLLDFQGAKNDARIGAIAYVSSEGDRSFWLGASDIDFKDKRVRGYPNLEVNDLKDKIFFIFDKNTKLQSVFDIEPSVLKDLSPENIAEYIHNNLFGQEIIFGLGTGVAIMRNGKFEIGVYNNQFDEGKIEEWKAQYSKLKNDPSFREFMRP